MSMTPRSTFSRGDGMRDDDEYDDEEFTAELSGTALEKE